MQVLAGNKVRVDNADHIAPESSFMVIFAEGNKSLDIVETVNGLRIKLPLGWTDKNIEIRPMGPEEIYITTK